jgi:hypothetical protein
MPHVTGPRVRKRVGAVVIALVSSAIVVGSPMAAEAGSASSKAQAKKLLLTLKDMPKGWKTEKGTGGNNSNNFPGATQLASCIGVPSSLITGNPPEVDSPYFETKSGLLEVQDSISVFSSNKTAVANLDAMANAKTPACMATLMNGSYKAQILAAAGAGATLGTITVNRADLAGFPKGTTGIVMSLPITAQGESIDATLTAVYYIKGTLGQEIDFNSYGPTTFPTSLAKSLTSTALRRL